MTTTPSRAARLAAGFLPEVAAKRLRITRAYLLQMERQNNWPLETAKRAARLYQASLNDFLPTRTGAGSARREREAEHFSLPRRAGR